jgi:hypothetical protein
LGSPVNLVVGFASSHSSSPSLKFNSAEGGVAMTIAGIKSSNKKHIGRIFTIFIVNNPSVKPVSSSDG